MVGIKKSIRVGVLALQGAFSKHIQMLKSIGVEACEVKTRQELETCDGLIIPGGESTTMTKHIQYSNLRESLQTFGQEKPIFGTCAGLILISSAIIGGTMEPFNFLNITVERNAFGRQIDSFQTNIELQLQGKKAEFPAVFIRAPRIKHVGPEVEVIGSFKGEPVLVKQGKHLGATFHPELTYNSAVHKFFISLIST